MGVLENLDFNNINFDIFKNFKCLCELCDDGCFDRMKQTHHPECKKKFGNKNTRPKTNYVNSKKCYLTHYQENFISNYNPRPSTAYLPPKDLFLYVPKGSMDLNTIQKTDYKPPEPQEKVKPFKYPDSHEKSNEPFTHITAYKREFIPKENNGLANIVKKNSNEPSVKIPIVQISTTTTSKEHFKEWNRPRMPSRGFSEYPSYAGESLFPTKERSFITSTKSVYKPIDVTKLNSLSRVELKGSLVSEGEMKLATNYRDTYVKHDNILKTNKIVSRNQNDIITSNKKLPVSGVTQMKSDYVFHPDHVPPKQADCDSFSSNLNQQIYPGNDRDHNTNYSLDFVPKEPSKAKTCKKENPPYEKPIQKIENETVTKRDFKPIDMSKIPVLRAQKLNNSLKILAGPMETKTMAMTQFVPYEVKPVIMAKDPNPYYYIPNKTKFIGETTTGQTYLGQQGSRSTSFKPDYDNLKIDKTKIQDTETNYKADFVKHGLTMCEAKAFLIANALNKNKQTEIQLVNGKIN